MNWSGSMSSWSIVKLIAILILISNRLNLSIAHSNAQVSFPPQFKYVITAARVLNEQTTTLFQRFY